MLHHAHAAPNSPTGTLFIQPRVDTRDTQNALLDDVLGTGFAVVCWSNNLRAVLGEEAFGRWKALGAKFVEVRPMSQLRWPGHDDPDVAVIGDRTGALKAWFDVHTESVLFVRPDRCIAAACIAQRAPEISEGLFAALHLTSGAHLTQGGGTDGEKPDRAVLHVAQPAAESSGTGAGTS